jgi:hypothetical protein
LRRYLKNFTLTKVAKRMEQVDASIARYLTTLDRADREESDIAEAKTRRIKDKIAGLRRRAPRADRRGVVDPRRRAQAAKPAREPNVRFRTSRPQSRPSEIHPS